MAMDQQKFLEVQARAKTIIDMDNKGLLEKYKNKTMDGFDRETGEFIEENFAPTPSTSTMTRQPQQMVNQGMMGGSKLPKEIMMSMKNNPISIQNSGFGENVSVLDSIMPKQMLEQQTVSNKPTIKEETMTPIQTNIDYSLIKTIVEDCVKKSIGALKKSLLTENICQTNNTNNDAVIIRLGEGFKFVTKSGDIYAATGLKKIGNVNTK
jgi:hypothetical protein